jgi:hypothetical protein
MPTSGARTVSNLINRGEMTLRRTWNALIRKQRDELPVRAISSNQGVPADLLTQWENEYFDWFTLHLKFWQNLWDRSIKNMKLQKVTSQEAFDDYINTRAATIGLELSAVSAAVIDQVLVEHSVGSVGNLARGLKESIGLNPRQFSAFTKQARQIDKIYKDNPERAQLLKDRLYNKKINYRAQLIARTEISTAVNNAQLADINSRIEANELPADMQKRWSTIGDERTSEECLLNEAQGWLPLDGVFQSGHEHPPRFPSCRCGLQFRVRREAA